MSRPRAPAALPSGTWNSITSSLSPVEASTPTQTSRHWVGPSVKEHPDFIWVPGEPLPFPLKRKPAVRLEVVQEMARQADSLAERASLDFGR